MPFGGLLTAGLAVGGSLLGGAAGAANTRPPSLDPAQKGALDNLLIPTLSNTIKQTPGIDPVQQQLMYGNIARSTTGANNAVTNALVSRGLGHSGLLGEGLMQNQNAAVGARAQSDLGLQQQAIQLRQSAIQQLIQSLGIGNTPGQSGAGGFLAGMAPLAAYSIQNYMNSQNTPQLGGTPPLIGNPGDITGSLISGGGLKV